MWNILIFFPLIFKKHISCCPLEEFCKLTFRLSDRCAGLSNEWRRKVRVIFLIFVQTRHGRASTRRPAPDKWCADCPGVRREFLRRSRALQPPGKQIPTSTTNGDNAAKARAKERAKRPNRGSRGSFESSSFYQTASIWNVMPALFYNRLISQYNSKTCFK